MSDTPASIFNRKALRNAVPRSFIKRIEVFQSVESTNETAKKRLADGVTESALILAEEQTRGRGRFGRVWEADPGQNLTFSLLLSPPIPRHELGILPLLTAVSVARAIERETNLRVLTKWPNDLLINTKKVCGILLETGSAPDTIVVGIGVNVNQTFFSPTYHATSLHAEQGRPVDRFRLLVSILHQLKWFGEPDINGKILPMFEEWQARCSMLKRTVRVQIEHEVVSGVARAVTRDGALILTVDGKDRTVHAGEVTLAPF